MAHKKKKHEEEHENVERWLLTYADMITLLMLFFIILYSMSKIDAKKYNELNRVFQTVFGGGEIELFSKGQFWNRSGGPQDTRSTPIVREKKGRSSEIFGTLTKVLDSEINSGKVEVATTEHGIVVRLFTDVMFKRAEADLEADFIPTISHISGIMYDLTNQIRINGHTDDSPLPVNSSFKNNWELSTSRAITVLREFIERGIDANRLAVAGYSSTQPLAANETPERQALNRRVEIIILNEEFGFSK